MDSQRETTNIEWPPDEPIWIDVRSMLESGGPRFGQGPDFVVCDPAPVHTVAVVGRPTRDVFDRAGKAAEPRFEVLCLESNLDWVESRLVPGWASEKIVMHEYRGVMGPQTAPAVEDSPQAARPMVRIVALNDSLDHLPERMRREMERARTRHALFAVFVDGQPVSFAYAHRTTSTLADISIDTLAPHRRLGYARAACLHLIDHLHRIGLAPTWGAYESNEASLALAAELGFVRVGTIWGVTPPRQR